MWQSQMRQLQSELRPNVMTCITRTGRDILYSDFARVEHFDPDGTADSWMLHNSKDERPKTDYPPRRLREGGIFIEYGVPNKKFEILIHARDRSHRVEDNWVGWRGLELGDSVASIGSKTGARHIEGTSDMRGIPLEELVNYMAGAKMIVGPSSGPMHLATLCSCPQVVWSNRTGTLERYKKTWNPFRVKTVTALSRNPSVWAVMEMIEEIR
jgi:hypothetical protein